MGGKRADTTDDAADKYEKMSPREHVLRRPDTYIGSIGVVEEPHDIFRDGKVVSHPIAYTPGLAKIFDECLVNALDHVVRLRETPGTIQQVTKIAITIDRASGELSVCNDGDGIDVVKHPKYGMYVPQLVFGELLTSTNYKDSDAAKLWGGRNGYGAKLANIWSTWFEVETFDRERSLLYRQKFESNMERIGSPRVTSKKTGRAYTRISFLPDYARMGLDGLGEDMAALMFRRAYDAAGTTPASVAITLNGDPVPVRSFKDYVALYDSETEIAAWSSKGGRWDIALTSSLSGSFEQVSFVNGVATRKGGSHVNHVANMIAKAAAQSASKKGVTYKPAYIKDNMRLFLRCVVPNPTFSSQTKEELTSAASTFSSTLDIGVSDIAKLVKVSGVMERAEALMAFKESRAVKAAAGKKKSRLFIPKLDDANNAGTKNSKRCTLILTEGDSAKTMAISGLAVVGRDDYGVFPLRGKLLNITDRSVASALKNEEVANIVKILGLKPGEKNGVDDLRYGRVMIMADADDDGIHIRALTMNLFRVLFPDLFRTTGFLVSMLTPVIKARLPKEVLSFYSTSEFRAWEKKHPRSSHTIKYLKGLGSSTSEEAKAYFRDMRVVRYVHSPTSDDRMSLAFSKTRADDRKAWLMSYSDATSEAPDYARTEVDYATFVDTELIHFSIRDVARSLPHIMDGLKESTRKILFGAFKHTPRDTHIKVAQLAGFVGKIAMYHHGEDSLNKAITAMAQSFPGSNNLPLLEADGQFGTRLQGGEDRASPRYIHTRLAKITTRIFRPEDECILEFRVDEGVQVEPITYYPIIPLLLANGAIGIGTGFSTTVPMFDPGDLIDAVVENLDTEHERDLIPWFRGWSGTIETDEKGGFVSCGRYSRTKNNRVILQELPAYRWTEDQKHLLEGLVADGVFKNVKPRYTDTEIEFEIECGRDVSDEELVKLMQLRSNRNLSTNNIHAFSVDGRVTRFASIWEVLRTWIPERLRRYEQRKASNLETMRRDLVTLSAKARFIEAVVAGEIQVMNVSADKIVASLKAKKYPQDDSGYDYLLKMPINQLTRERKAKLLEDEANMQEALAELEKTSPRELWKRELAELKKAWEDERKNA